MAVKEKKIIFFQDVTATLGDGLAWIAPLPNGIFIENYYLTNVDEQTPILIVNKLNKTIVGGDHNRKWRRVA